MPSNELQLPETMLMPRARPGSLLLALVAAGALAASPVAALWPSYGGGVEADTVRATTVDANGNVYAIGTYYGTAFFGEETLYARGLADVFVVKQDSSGKVLWAASAGGLLPDDGYDIVVDAAQNVYVIGSFIKEMQFESDDDVLAGPPLELGRTGSAGRDWFVGKLDSQGGWLWAREISHTTGGQQVGYALALAPAVNDPINPIPAGVFAGGLAACAQLVREDESVIRTDCDNRPIKVYRLDSDGEWVWTLTGGDAGNNLIWISEMASDANNQLYVVGSFLGNNNLATSPSTPLTFTGVPAGGVLEFKHRFAFDVPVGSCYDGGVLEYSTNGGGSWYDILSGQADNDPSTTANQPRFLQGQYNGTLNGQESNPLGSRSAYCNTSGGTFWTTRVDLGGFAGQSVRFRWRMGTGYQIGETGWNLDDIKITAGTGDVLLNDNVEAGGGNFSPSGTAGITPWSIATNFASSPTHSWYVPDGGSISDQILAMGQSLELPEGTPSMFVAKIGSAGSTTPFWQWAGQLPTRATADALATDGAGGLFVAGTTSDPSSSFGGNVITTMGAYAAKLTDNGTSFAWQWARGASGGEAADITVLFGGDLAVAGTYAGSPSFDAVQIDPVDDAMGTSTKVLPAADDTEIFVARLAGSGSTWRWVTFAGDFSDPLDPQPSNGFERGTAVSGSPDGAEIYVGGSFDGLADFGTIEVLAIGETDAVVANLVAADGAWFAVDFQRRVVGEEVVPPLPADELCLTHPALSVPLIEIVGPGQAIPDYFHWTPPDVIDPYGHLFAVQPVNAVVRWKKDASCPFDSEIREDSPGATDWPREPDGDIRYCGSADADAHPGEPCVQLHLAGAPVDIEPPTAGISFGLLATPRAAGMSPDAEVIPGGVGQAKFNAQTPGFSVLIFADHPSSRDIVQERAVIRPVETVAYDTPLQIDGVPVFTDATACTIGEEITEPSHEDHGGKNGYVLNERAYFDGVGADRAYDRLTRLGQIIPVNRVPPASLGDDDMAIAWYKKDADTIAWPQRSIRYDCKWPVNPDKIIIASELGSEVLGQPPLNPLNFPGARIYNQADDTLPGFNPNDEHALLLPANSASGFSAVFALRSDHSAAELARSSEPYVLMKYVDPGDGTWRYRVYQVLATGAGYETFQYNGVAGTPVNPPYPVRLLGNCAESEVTGKPAFKDYKNQTWAKAAGDLVAEYWYPLQPTFFYDRAGNHVPEKTTGQCVSWLGGLLDDPVDVFYSITWPPEVPSLLVGETLMQPKFGLPDIANQAAVEIVYDEKVDRWLEAEEYAPKTSLARIIDPLTSRVAYLPAIPPEIGTEMDVVTGRVIPVSDAAGVEQLPSTLVSRVSYDPLNKKLYFAGLFEQPPIGEPVLLINVLTQDERRRLKRLDGGDGTEEESYAGDCASLDESCSWDQAIEALYNISRNPLRLDLDLDNDLRCHIESFEDPPGTGIMVQQVVCDSPTDGDVDEDLLLGLQDEDGDTIPEPLAVVGFTPALTAGFAQGTGYLTLAFNNDPSLNPLPVSLNVIRIDCLRVPQDPPPDIVSTYVGEIKIIEPGGVFDEALTLRHSGDFAGSVDGIEFEWFFHPDEDGLPPSPNPDPDNGQLNGWLQFTDLPSAVGAIDITIEGANIQTLSDNWYLVRYRYVDPPIDVGDDGLPGTGDDGPLCGGDWSIFAGQPSPPTDPKGQLAEGWVKRVVKGLGPFESRVKDFHSGPTNTYASMLFQLGERYEGDIALNDNPDNLNAIGLISAYQTVLNRARKLSIDGTPPIDYAPVNNAILLVASRLADFYTLLGNEAYGDAADPMIGFGTGSGIYGSLAPAVFAFQNQLDSLLEEELTLLRGRDDGQATVVGRPVYNRLFWNFTTGEGEFAYQVNYNITDQDLNGVVDEADAKVLFPQGHGDAWGHYLTALTTYYELLQHPFFTWIPRPEAVTVGGAPVQVDFLDERKFAKIAAAKARAGAEIVDLTYRLNYVEDPAGQWQGYKDTDLERAWGLSEWGRRAGQGAYFDWVVGNAILPEEDPNPEHVGIQRVDRQNVDELLDISAQYASVQEQVDEADRGLNPLGLAKNVVPFDIDPAGLDPILISERKTHFEQIHERAMAAMDNAVSTWDFANQLTELIRRTQDDTEAIYSNNFDQEIDFKNRLIEIFGYPYDADIGPTGTYPEGYDGPDVYHYMYVDQTDLTGSPGDEVQTFTATFDAMPNGIGHFDFEANDPSCDSAFDDDCSLDEPDTTTLDVTYHVTTRVRSSQAAGNPTVADSFFFVKPPEWGSSQRRAPGDLQGKLSDLLVAMNAYEQILTEYNNLVDDIIDQADLIEATFDVKSEQINIKSGAREELVNLTIAIEVMKGISVGLRRTATLIKDVAQNSSDCVPKNLIAGVAAGGDVLSAGRCAVVMAGGVVGLVSDLVADGLDIATSAMDAAKEDVEKQAEIEVDIQDASLELFEKAQELEKLFRQEALIRLEAYSRKEAVDAARGNYQIVLAQGQRTLAELAQWRANSAADIQTYRYRDMAFRIFRNDAIQKYRAQFDLAARYTYLAATAYDYETNLLGDSNAAGRRFLTSIVKERALGQIIDGEPVPGSRGLAGPLGQMSANFSVLKGQLGFNNPQVETNRFSLRREMMRLFDGSDEEWRTRLENLYRVDDLWRIPEFRIHCKPFAPESSGPQPGLVIPFETTVTFGLNFFGWPLGPGDSAYDASHFATKVNSVGVWLGSYNGLPLSNTPRVYLVPVGADVLRSPSDDLFKTREWQIIDQALPVPFPLGGADLDDPTWIPMNDTLSETFGTIRRIPLFRAYHSENLEDFDPEETHLDSRLVGRSVWNRKWLLIIPGGTLLNDADEGLDTLIHGQLIPGGGGERDGEGIDDILVFFMTYAYSGI